jgi:hypothetical protein
VENDLDFLEKRRKYAFKVLRTLIEFIDFEKNEVPNDFIGTIEGLTSIVMKPSWFLFDDENGRWRNQEEQDEFKKRLNNAINIAKKNLDSIELKNSIIVKKCHYCESLILSDEAKICLWCSEPVL